MSTKLDPERDEEPAGERSKPGRASRLDEEEREQLERERDFLLKSLDDLERERETGNIDDESYRELHDDYTARAAAAIRALRDGVDTKPQVAPWSWKRRAVVITLIVAFGAASAVALAAALGARLPGQTSSGNSQAPASSRKARLEAAVARHPNDPRAHLDLADFLARNGDVAAALKEFDTAVKIDPNNGEALAQSARARVVTAEQVPDNNVARQLVGQARSDLDRAVQVAAAYPDAHFFRALVLWNWYSENDAAVAEFQRYLVLAPNGQWADQARQGLNRILNPAPTTTPATTNP